MNGSLLRDLWPNDLGKGKKDTRTIADLSAWEKMPSSYIDLSFWADVVVDHAVHKVIGANGPRTPYALLWSPSLYPGTPTPPRRCSLIRLHGFLSSYCIRPLGTWTGYRTFVIRRSPSLPSILYRKVADVKSAAQFVTLEGKGINEAFDPQLENLFALSTLIHKSINDRSEPVRDTRATLNLRRRVFTRVCALILLRMQCLILYRSI